MKVLLLGSTGMLGQAIFNKLKENQINVLTIARSNSQYHVDLAIEPEKIREIIQLEKPDIVINSSALINLRECEDDPGKAYMINARVPGVIAEICKNTGAFFVQISTDHYYLGDGESTHSENDQVFLMNEYARTKYAGEIFALTYKNSLVIRTNIVGFRNIKNNQTFVEWVIHSLENEQMISGFEDFYTSSIDVYHFTDILMELIKKKVTGLINVASKDVLSKYHFIYKLAILLGKENFIKRGTINQLEMIQRGNSLGLDVTKLKSVLNEELIPSSNQVVQKIVEKYKEGAFYELQQRNNHRTT